MSLSHLGFSSYEGSRLAVHHSANVRSSKGWRAPRGSIGLEYWVRLGRSCEEVVGTALRTTLEVKAHSKSGARPMVTRAMYGRPNAPRSGDIRQALSEDCAVILTDHWLGRDGQLAARCTFGWVGYLSSWRLDCLRCKYGGTDRVPKSSESCFVAHQEHSPACETLTLHTDTRRSLETINSYWEIDANDYFR